MKTKACISIKNIVVILLNCIFASSINAQTTITTPRPVSPSATVKQKIGLTEITVKYSRPSVVDAQGNDRTGKIWGTLVPFGFNIDPFGSGNPAPWRAGANENTTITFSDDVKIKGTTLVKGTYGLFIAVHEDNTATVVFSNNSTSWGSFYYDVKEDAFRVDVKTETIPQTKILTFSFIDYTSNSTTLALDWEKLRFPIKIDIDVNAVVLNNMRNELRSVPGFNWQGFMTAAQYCVNNKTNLDEGITWIDQSITMNRNAQNLMVKSQLLALKGDKMGSDSIIDIATATADNVQLNAIGYQLIAAGNIDKAIELFKLNVERNPKDANAHDSLGEAYKINRQNDLAIKSFKKSLSLNPPPNVKSNSLKHLKELGVEM